MAGLHLLPSGTCLKGTQHGFPHLVMSPRVGSPALYELLVENRSMLRVGLRLRRGGAVAAGAAAASLLQVELVKESDPSLPLDDALDPKQNARGRLREGVATLAFYVLAKSGRGRDAAAFRLRATATLPDGKRLQALSPPFRTVARL